LRRTTGLLVAAAILGAAAPERLAAETVASAPVVDDVWEREEGDERLDGAIAEVRTLAQAAGVGKATLDRALRGLTIDPTILPLLTSQPEHALAPWDYIGRLVSDTRIDNGRRLLAEHAAVLAEVEARTGVDRHVVVAIWGVESSFGTLPGARSVVRSLATLVAMDTRRPAFWRKELVAALQILDRGDITPERMTGSWAGAMGHTQFMPSSFLAHAVDHDGDGRRDIWGSVPDALASTATYLARSGWKAGEPWGLEVVPPAGFDFRLADGTTVRPIEEWRRLGVAPPFGLDVPPGLTEAAMLLPAGMHGPALLVGGNYRAILRYNAAMAYAVAVGHLADRLSGRPPLAQLWPTDDPPLGRAERRELQQRLLQLGHAVGPIDGVIGDTTRNAVRNWQRQIGLPEDGWTGARLLSRLRSTAAADPSEP
jgi:glucose-6-phosphate 1-epimerase